MVAVVETYQNGFVKFDKEYSPDNPVKAIATCVEDVNAPSEKIFSLSDFSFAKNQKASKSFKDSFSDTVIEERMLEL